MVVTVNAFKIVEVIMVFLVFVDVDVTMVLTFDVIVLVTVTVGVVTIQEQAFEINEVGTRFKSFD